ncbi:uncharacterized protein FFMR_05359 [Fusarium fujikuroi]|nr:uncharacterized protein FFMR_05359 [Fusarium fujikuroi]
MSSVREYTNPRTLVWGNPEGDSLVNAAAVGVMLVNPPKSSNTELAFREQTLLIFAVRFLNHRSFSEESFWLGPCTKDLTWLLKWTRTTLPYLEGRVGSL